MMKSLLDPSFGMFKYFEDTRLLWFSSDCLEQPSEYELVGVLTGIAIYNGVILDLCMPSALYKKLTGDSTTLQDLAVLQVCHVHTRVRYLVLGVMVNGAQRVQKRQF